MQMWNPEKKLRAKKIGCGDGRTWQKIFLKVRS